MDNNDPRKGYLLLAATLGDTFCLHLSRGKNSLEMWC